MLEAIGGYLELESFSGSEYYPDAVSLNNARNSLLYILRARQISKLYIPCYLCDAVSGMLEREHIAYDYYHVGADFLPEPAFLPEDGATVYLVNYYGMLSNERILALQCRFGSVILDNVQAFFQRRAEGVDTVYSCRKFFGVPDGGYAATEARLSQPLVEESVMNRLEHLIGRFETGSAGAWYSFFQRSEALHDIEPLRAMSRISHNLLRAVNYDQVRIRREENCHLLSDLLRDANPLTYTVPVGPYAYPFYAERGPTLRKRLASEGIYIPTLWPTVEKNGNETERRLAANILPLPCDQRYGREQMLRMAKRLLELLNA